MESERERERLIRYVKILIGKVNDTCRHNQTEIFINDIGQNEPRGEIRVYV